MQYSGAHGGQVSNWEQRATQDKRLQGHTLVSHNLPFIVLRCMQNTEDKNMADNAFKNTGIYSLVPQVENSSM